MKFEKHLKHVPLSLFCLYFIRVAIFSMSYPESAALAVLGLVACYFQSKNNEEKLKDFEEKLQKSNKELEDKLSKSIQSFEAKVHKVESIESQINALKLNSLNGFRPASGAGNGR